jgi:hypothetical protein
MAKTKDTAQADEIPHAKVIATPTETGTAPGLLFKGKAPAKGSTFAAILPNGATYAGVVADTQAQAGGSVLVTFRDGIAQQD